MNQKIVGYIGVAIIGVGFIMMAASNTLLSETASILQAILGAVFIVAAVVRMVQERKKKAKATPHHGPMG